MQKQPKQKNQPINQTNKQTNNKIYNTIQIRYKTKQNNTQFNQRSTQHNTTQHKYPGRASRIARLPLVRDCDSHSDENKENPEIAR
jgi:hypothetical protein